MIAIWVFLFAVFMVIILSVSKFIRGKNQARLNKTRQLLSQRNKLFHAIEQLRAEYSKDFEERKVTIGTIKCTQCAWTGQWGTGMSYEQFFAGNLAEAGIQVSDRNIYNDNLSRDNRQYTCPVCNSDKWEKV